ncbi:MAG: hypothetical protein K0R54_1239 [Clostridiaceae bacterium]|jgi:uncharacterized membrane protein YcaP (DUF421 family)|nr:hypothetical protein [Clostridiaceae bacterium]
MEYKLMASLTIELLLGFFALLILTKFMGKTQISQITPFNFISALVLGELVGNAIYSLDVNLLYILYSLGLWTFLVYFIEIATQKKRKLRAFFEDKPSVIIVNGQIDFIELKRSKLDLDELQGLLRQKDVFLIKDVKFAILETNGALSILKTEESNNIKITLPINLIMDGEVILENLKACDHDMAWVNNELKTRGINDIKKVFLAQWTEEYGIHISIKNDIRLYKYSL